MDFRFDTPQRLAEAIRTQKNLGLGNGVVISNPIEQSLCLDYDDIEQLINSTAPQRYIGAKWQPVFGDQFLFAAAIQQATINDDHSMRDEPLRTSIRLAYSPVHQPGNIAHLGASGQFVNYKDARRNYQLGVVPESKLAGMPKVISTGKLNAESSQVAGLEAAFTYGPLSLASEFMHHHVRTTDFKSYGFNGGYLQASYFLDNQTSRTYSMADGVQQADKPESDLGTGTASVSNGSGR